MYVAKSSSGDKTLYHETGLVGDELTIGRAVNCQLSVANAFTPDDRLEGMHAEIADWHTEMNFLGVSYLTNIYNAQLNIISYSYKSIISSTRSLSFYLW